MSIAMTVPPLEGLEPNLVCLAYFLSSTSDGNSNFQWGPSRPRARWKKSSTQQGTATTR